MKLPRADGLQRPDAYVRKRIGRGVRKCARMEAGTSFKIYIMENTKEQYYDTFLGCIMGGAFGDAYGFPVEYLRLSEIVERYGRKGITAPDAGPNGRIIVSDDTQMTLFTMDGLTTGMMRVRTHRTDSPAEVYIDRAYLDWYATQHPRMPYTRPFTAIYTDRRLRAQRAPGRTTLSSLAVQFQNVADPRDEFDIGQRGTIEKPISSSKTCGALMRTAPIGLMLNGENYNIQADSVAAVAARAAAITHGHPFGYLPAALFAEIISRMTYRRMAADPTLERLMNNALYQIELQFRGTRDLELFIAEMEKAIRMGCDRSLKVGTCLKELGDGWNADSALANAIFLVLRFPNDYYRAIHAAVNRTGDSDTIGSVTGNLLGAWIGYQELSRQLDDIYHTKGYLADNLEMYDLIEETVRRAFRVSLSGI